MKKKISSIRGFAFVSAIGLLTILLISSLVRRSCQTTPAQKKAFTTSQPTRTTIRQVINTTGVLTIKDSSRIGSLVAGTVQEILVKENDWVKKGQLLAVLDNGKSDTTVRMAQGRLEQAEAEYEYAAGVYERESALFKSGHRSEQDIAQHKRAMQVAHGNLTASQATLDAAQIEYDNTRITSPDDGLVMAVGIRKGYKVTTDLNATVLFEIARNMKRMEAEVEIDESDVIHVQKGQKVSFTVDSYDQRTFKAHIVDISYAPVRKSNGLSYTARIEVDNSSKLLRPGMTIHAKIKVGKAKDALGVDTQAFYLDEDAVIGVGRSQGLEVKPLPSAEKKAQSKEHKTIRYLWVYQDGSFVERPIITGAQDNRFIEAQDGLEEVDNYLIDVEQAGGLDAHYKKMFQRAL